MYYTYRDTPVGKILIAGDHSSLRIISFPSGNTKREVKEGWCESESPFISVITQLDEYFQGRRDRFDLPLSPEGTQFQKQVWNALLTIPFGATMSYGELARTINRPKASRAVGAANGANPIPIIIPCHRVIGSTGSLTGFGGGIPTKQWLLAHEKQYAAAKTSSNPQVSIRFD